MRIYLSGAITGRPTDEYKREFREAEQMLWNYHQETINPARLDYLVPDSFNHKEYMHICIPLLETCDGIYMLKSWMNSKGANEELEKAIDLGLDVMGHAIWDRVDGIRFCTYPNMSIINPPKANTEPCKISVGEYATVNTGSGRYQQGAAVQVIGITDPKTDPENILVKNAEGQTTTWYREEDLLISREEAQ